MTVTKIIIEYDNGRQQTVRGAIPQPLLDAIAAAVPAPPPPAGGNAATVRDAQEWSALLARGIRPDATIILAEGDYPIGWTLRLPSGVTLTSADAARAKLRWTGPSDQHKSLVEVAGKGVTVRRLHLACAGCDAFSIKGNGATIEDCTAEHVSDFVISTSGADDTAIRANVVPQVDGYFVYASGGKTTDAAGQIVVNPIERLTIAGNTCGGSVHQHVLRFHDTFGARVEGNRFARPNPVKGEVRTIAKIHDGGDIHIFDNDFSGRDAAGNHVANYTVITLGPLGGKDGGINETSPAKRQRALALQLDGVIFARNRCDDVLIHLSPGVKNVAIDQNTFAHVRGVAVDFKATENGQDYRPWRGEATGAIRGNTIALAPGETRQPFSVPAAVAHSGNTVNGTQVD